MRAGFGFLIFAYLYMMETNLPNSECYVHGGDKPYDSSICFGVELGKLDIDCSSVLAIYPDIELSQLQTIQFHVILCCLSFKKTGTCTTT